MSCVWNPACKLWIKPWNWADGLGIASRIASGYLIQFVADVKSLDRPSGTERDFTDLLIP